MRISEYLATFAACLELPEPGRREALAEIESHLREAAVRQGASDADPTVPALSALGSPRSAAARLTLAYRPPRRDGRASIWGFLSRIFAGERRTLAYFTAYLGWSEWSDLMRPLPGPSGLAGWGISFGALLGAVLVYRVVLALFARMTKSEIRRAGVAIGGILMVVPLLGVLRNGLVWPTITVDLLLLMGYAIVMRSVTSSAGHDHPDVERHDLRDLGTPPPKRYFLVFVGFWAAFMLLVAAGPALHLRTVPLAVTHVFGNVAILGAAAGILRFGTPQFIRPLTVFVPTVLTLFGSPLFAIVLLIVGDPWGAAASLVLCVVTWVPSQRLIKRVAPGCALSEVWRQIAS